MPELERLESLRRYRIVDTPREPAFDEIARLAAVACRAPMSLVGLIDETRLWPKASFGIDLAAVPRESSTICRAILESDALVVVADAPADARFRSDPLVADGLGIRALAGAAITSPEGHVLGALCVFDRAPRALAADQLDALSTLARLATAELELRRHRLEAEHLSQRRHQELVESVDGIVWEADPKTFRFTFVSRQAERILGFAAERWVDDPSFWYEHVHPDDRTWALDYCASEVRARRNHQFEYRMIAADGRTVWLRDVTSVIVEGGEVARLRGVFVDVTQRKLAEEMLRRTEEHLRHSQKMEAIGRLAGGVAHDFNNMLAAISGYTELALSRVRPSDSIRDLLLDIQQATERAASLTNQLLAFSRRQVLKPRTLDLNEVVAGMTKMLRRLIGEHIELEMRLERDVGCVRADPGQIEQVILNLAVNARDAMPRGGTLALATSAPREGYVRLTVADTGCGMDQATLARIFEPFFTTKDQGKGTGLGLSTIYGIVTQSDGHVDVTSAPGRGTTFTIDLPRASPSALATERAEDPVPPPAGASETVLLVEDEDLVRKLFRQFLGEAGYSVLVARDGEEALRACREHEGPIQVMLSDIVMPKMSGIELASRVAALRPETEVLLVSGYSQDAAAREGALASFTFLQKPFTREGLLRKMREVIDGARGKTQG